MKKVERRSLRIWVGVERVEGGRVRKPEIASVVWHDTVQCIRRIGGWKREEGSR